MPSNAPIIRVDRQYMDEIELRVAEVALMQVAEVVNYIGKGGAIYGQLVLPPHEAAMKRNAMNRGA